MLAVLGAHDDAAFVCPGLRGIVNLGLVESPLTLERSARLFADSDELKLVLHPDNGQAISTLPAMTQVAIAIGPEGGFSDRDLAVLDQSGFRRITLGPRILRTETAGLATITALQSRFGDLG